MAEDVSARLSLRALVVGIVIGTLAASSNLFVTLKVGWSLPVMVPAAIGAYSVFSLLLRTGLSSPSIRPTELAIVSTIASSAGYMSGGGNMAALPALWLSTHQLPSAAALVVWCTAVASLGIVLAGHFRSAILANPKLRFPTGIAAGEVMQVLTSGKDARRQVRLLVAAFVLGLLVSAVHDRALGAFALPHFIALGGAIRGVSCGVLTLGVETSLLLASAGAIMSLRVGWSSLLGAVTSYVVLVPILLERSVLTEASYAAIVRFMVWPSASILLFSAFTSFALEGRRLVEALKLIAPQPESRGRGGMAIVLATIVSLLFVYLFHVPWWLPLLVLPMSVVVAIVAIRSMGETDVVPTKALAPLAQLGTATFAPGDLVANLIAPNVACGVALHAADAMTSFRVGERFGASPRTQQAAGIIGACVGGLVTVPLFLLLVHDEKAMPSPLFPVPGVLAWKSISEALGSGLSCLPRAVHVAIAIAALLGVILSLAERFVPPKFAAFVPSPTAIGSSLVLPASSSLSIFWGASIATLVHRRTGASAILICACGLIAGESIGGIVPIVIRTIAGW